MLILVGFWIAIPAMTAILRAPYEDVIRILLGFYYELLGSLLGFHYEFTGILLGLHRIVFRISLGFSWDFTSPRKCFGSPGF